MKKIEQKYKSHKEIIYEICMNINNCANCYNEETRQTECTPFHCVQLYDVSRDSFCMEPYGEKTNRLLDDIAKQYGYKVDFIMKGKIITCIKFYKQ